jgi:hydrogenase maturation protease
MSERPLPWEELERPGPDSVEVAGVELRAGSRVVLRPRPGGDVLDLALAGMTAVVEGIDEDVDGGLKLAVVVEADPGRDLGAARQPGHRFFFSPEEVEPLDAPASKPGRRILVAGIGNVFLGDDGFGVALVDRLSRRDLPAGVEVRDFGIRGMDLAYALLDGYDAAVLLDATPRGGHSGSLYVIEPELDDSAAPIDTHGMDPVKMLALARSLGDEPLPRILVVGCEPHTRMSADAEEIVAELSEPVRAALDEAVRLTESLLSDLTSTEEEVGAP